MQRLPLRRTGWRRALGLLLAGGLTVLAHPAWAAGGSAALTDQAGNDVSNIASLQRGARNFVNFCMGCHSAKYVTYSRLAADLQITEKQLIDNLMFAAQRPQETMVIAMPEADAARWFGQPPPDLSLIARSKGVDYLYNFLRGFYLDPSRPIGVNNVMLPNASMPHVLWELQGTQEAVFVQEEHAGLQETVFKEFREVTPGTLSAEAYDDFVRDLVNFLAYIGEPVQLKRQQLGIWVLAFLLVFWALSYLLKKEIWKDVK